MLVAVPPAVHSPLTAKFEGLPDSHDGSTPFAFRIVFSEAIDATAAELRDEALAVTGASVTAAARAAGPEETWQITLAPAGGGDIAILLEAGRACSEAGAICTPDGRKLEVGVGVLLPGPRGTTIVPSGETGQQGQKLGGGAVTAVEVAVAAGASPVSEGTAAGFSLTRAGSADAALTVAVQVSETGAMLASGAPSAVTFAAGESGAALQLATDDDRAVEPASAVTVAIAAGSGYAAAASGAAATVRVEDNDEAQFEVTAEPAEIAEGASATVTVRIANGVSFAAGQAIALAFSGSAAKSDDYTVSADSLSLAAGASAAAVTVTAVDDAAEEGAETVTVTASHAGAQVGSASVTIGASDAAETASLTASFSELPASHAGAEFTFGLAFSEEPQVSFRTLRDHAFAVSGGAVRRARRQQRGSNRRWTIHVEPEGTGAVALSLPATPDCGAAHAICTAGGKPLANSPTATVEGPGPEPSGFRLDPANSSPSGIWSDGETAWVADLADARLFAYRRSDGERLPDRDIATEAAPMGLWSDGRTLWAAALGGGLRAYRLADGARLAARDIALEANEAPAGVWSDGETAWVADWLGDTVRAYRLADGARAAGRDIRLASGNLLPAGLSSDGQTLWVADWRNRMYAYRLADGGREPHRDIVAKAAGADPTGLWSDRGALLATPWQGDEVRAFRLPPPASRAAVASGDGARADTMLAIADPALRAAIHAALGKLPGEAVSPQELAALATLDARRGGVRDLSGLEAAAGLRHLDLGHNPLADLRPLSALAALETLNLDGTAPRQLQPLAALAGLKRLSLRHSGIDDLGALAALAGLTELDVGDNRVVDLRPLAGLASLAVLRADRNRIANLWPLARAGGAGGAGPGGEPGPRPAAAGGPGPAADAAPGRQRPGGAVPAVRAGGLAGAGPGRQRRHGPGRAGGPWRVCGGWT